MADGPQWNNTPAIGVVLTRLVEIYTRALRVDMARRAQSIDRMAKLLKAKSEK
jgi:hypothetical protein